MMAETTMSSQTARTIKTTNYTNLTIFLLCEAKIN